MVLVFLVISAQRPHRDPKPLPHGRSKQLLAMNQERGSSSDHARMVTNFQSPELWEIHFCCLKTTQFVVFCYSSWNRLTQYHMCRKHHMHRMYHSALRIYQANNLLKNQQFLSQIREQLISKWADLTYLDKWFYHGCCFK